MLLAAGHPTASDYPIGVIMDEALIVRERIKQQEVNQAIWTQRAIAACLDKPGAKAFWKHVKDAQDGQQK